MTEIRIVLPDILIVHISDLHIKGPDSIGCKRLAAMAGPICARLIRDTHIVIVVSGDIAFSGHIDEYDAAAQAVEELFRDLDKWKPLSIRLYTAPGNHDCNFSALASNVRDLLIKNLGTSVDDMLSTIRVLAASQTDYNTFRDVVCSPTINLGELMSVANLDFEGRTVSITLLNSAWSSTLFESAGVLRLPATALPEYSFESQISFVALHHPLNWYSPSDVRSLSGWLDLNADVVLFGHEHELDDVEHRRRQFGSVVRSFIARPIDDQRSICGCTSLLISGEDSTTSIGGFTWLSDGTVKSDLETAPENFPHNPARLFGRLRFTTAHQDFLDDPGGAFQHPRLTRDLRLTEILVEPDFRIIEMDASSDESTKPSASTDDLIASIFSGEHAVVFGAEQSGKTTLAKLAIEQARQRGLHPLYLDAAKLSSFNRGEISGWINSAYSSQYAADCLDEVKIKPPAEKLVVIDNLHSAPGGTEGTQEIIKRGRGLASRTLILTGESPAVAVLSAEYSDTTQQGYWVDASVFELLPLGHKKRGDLIRRWVTIGRDGLSSNADIESESRRTKAALDNALGKSSIPKFPFFILILLQHIEIGRDINTAVSGGSQGYLFEALIVTALDLHAKSHPINTTNDYLAAFAFKLWNTDTQQMSSTNFNLFHQDFVERNLVEISRDLLMRDLERARILLVDGSSVAFRYPYLYYYFIARWATSVPRSESAALLDQLVAHIHTEKSANILTFIGYRERQDEVLNRLIPLANSLFAGRSVESLNEHSQLAAKFHSLEQRNVLLLGSPDRISDDYNSERDDIDGLPVDSRESSDRRDDLIKDSLNINTSLRIIQVLGHVMKSRASAISAEKKLEIAATSIGLARRLMSVLYEFIDDSADVLLKFATDSFEKTQKKSRDDAIAIANDFLSALVSAIAKMCIVRASESIASPELRPLLTRLESQLSDRDDLLVILMAKIAIDVDYPETDVDDFLYDVRDQDILTRNVVSFGAARRFYLDPPEHAMRDRACKKLRIDMKRVTSRTLPKPMR